METFSLANQCPQGCSASSSLQVHLHDAVTCCAARLPWMYRLHLVEPGPEPIVWLIAWWRQHAWSNIWRFPKIRVPFDGPQ